MTTIELHGPPELIDALNALRERAEKAEHRVADLERTAERAEARAAELEKALVDVFCLLDGIEDVDHDGVTEAWRIADKAIHKPAPTPSVCTPQDSSAASSVFSDGARGPAAADGPLFPRPSDGWVTTACTKGGHDLCLSLECICQCHKGERTNDAEREIDRLVASKTSDGRPMHPRTDNPTTLGTSVTQEDRERARDLYEWALGKDRVGCEGKR